MSALDHREGEETGVLEQLQFFELEQSFQKV